MAIMDKGSDDRPTMVGLLAMKSAPSTAFAESKFLSLGGAVALASTLLTPTAQAQELPTGGQVVAGQGSIASTSTTMTVTQNTANMAVNWQSFSIGQGNTVNFVQPSASAVALNRVLGSDVSVIQGALNANGKIFLINPNGVLFTPTAQVNVGSLVASTLNISTDDFMAGNYRFEGASSNAITNQGNITTANDGTVALIAAKIINTGQIDTPQGNVLMAAGNKVTLDMGGPVKIQVEKGALEALIEQGGGVRADGGLVYLTAKAAGELATAVINHTGITEARTLATGEKGEIILLGDMAQGETIVGGRLDASAPNGGDGGFIETSAAEVRYLDGFLVTAGSTYGTGGLWLIDPADAAIDQTIADGYVATLNTGTSVLNEVTGNITLNNGVSIAKTVGGDATLTFKATGNIVLDVNSSITSTSGALNTVLWADSDATSGGYIHIKNNSTIQTNGGSISLVGGTDGTGYAEGTSNPTVDPPHQDGISIYGSTLDSRVYISGTPQTSGGGTITLKGKGYAGNLDNHGGGLWAGFSSIDTGGGDLIMDVQAQESIGATEVGIRYGAYIDGTTISTNGGNVQISTASPNSTWTGFHSNSSLNAGAGDITIATDQISLNGATFSGTGALSIQPITPGTSIGIGTTSQILDLPASYFTSNFLDGFSNIIIGNSTAGAITVGGATTFRDDTTLITGSSVTASSNIALNGADLIINAALASTISGVLSGSGGLQTIGSGALGVSNANNTYTGQTSIAYGSTLATTDGYGESLSTTSHIQNSGTLEFSNSANVATIQSVAGSGNIQLNTSSIAIENNSGEVSGIISGSGGITLSGGELTLSGANTFTGPLNVSAATLTAKHNDALGNSGSGTTIADGATLILENDIAVADALSVAGTGVGGNGAIINRGTNTLNGAVTLVGADVNVVSESGTLTFGNTINGAYGLTLTGVGEVSLQGEVGGTTPLLFLDADAGETTHIGANVTTLGMQTYRNNVSAANNVILSAVGSAGATPVVVTAGLPTSAYDISGGSSPPGETVEQAFDGNNTTKYLNHNGEGSDVLIEGSSPFIVTKLKLTTANDAPERDPTAFILYGSNTSTTADMVEIASGSLSAPDARYSDYPEVSFENNTAYTFYRLVFTEIKNTSITNDVQIADVYLSGMSSTGDINPSITFGGAVTSSGNLSVDAVNAITISDTFNVGGNLNLISNSAIASNSAMTVAGTTSIDTSGNDITLENATNDFAGTVSVVSGNNVSLQDSGALALTASTIAGDLTLVSGGNITQTGALSVTGATSITAGSSNDITFTHNSNDFTGVVSIVSGNNVSLIDSNTMTLGAVNASGTVDIATLTGDLTLAGAVSTTNTTSSAMKLNAGKSTAAGTSSGGNIVVSGGSVSVGAGGTAQLYSGSLSGSTNLATLVGTGSGRFRYNADETTDFSAGSWTALGTGLYAIYREQPTVTITASDDTKTYNSAAYSGGNGYTGSGFVNGDTIASITGTPAYGGTSQGATNAGTYTLSLSGLDNGLGYALSYTDGTLTINKAALTISTADVTKTYDGTTSAAGLATVTAGTLFGSDAISGGTFAFNDKNAGSNKTVTVSGVTVSDGNSGNNYTVTYTDNTTSTINKAALTISSADVTKTYDGTTSAAGSATVTAGTLFGSDAISGGTFAFNDKNAGSNKTVTVSGVTVSDGNSGNNYTVTYTDNTTSTINKAALTISTADVTKTYDGTTSAAGLATVTAGTLFGSDAISGGTFAFDDKNVGSNKTVSVSGVTVSDGNSGNNYTVAYSNNNNSTINKATLTVTADDQTRPYGAPNPSFTQTISGFVNGENAITAGITGSAIGSSTATASSAAGAYVISGSTGSLAAGNYNFIAADGTLTIMATSPAQQSAVQAAQMLPPTGALPLSISGGLELVNVPGGTSDSMAPLVAQLPEGGTEALAEMVRLFVEDGGILYERDKRQ